MNGNRQWFRNAVHGNNKESFQKNTEQDLKKKKKTGENMSYG